jgi:glycerol-3-phosphate dehydrogenase
VTGAPGTPPDAADVAIIGAGVVGTAIARTLARYDLSIVVVDAATDVGTGTTKANTAILHTGFDAVPGSLESRLLRRGSALLRDYATRAGIPVERTGAPLVAWTDEQRRALPEIGEKARQNGYTAIRPVSAAGLYQREPHLGPGALAGLQIPDESVICSWTTPLAYATEAVRAGARLELGRLVTGVRSEAGGHALATTGGTVRCRWLVNAAGLGGDVIDAMLGGGGFTIRAPRRAHRVRQAGTAAGRLDPAAGADRGDQGGARRPDRVRQRAARAHRRGHRRPVGRRHHRGRPGRSARGGAQDPPGPGR